VTAFWYIIIALGFIAAIVNFSLAAARRKKPMVALVRSIAGVASLVPPVGILVGKLVLHAHLPSSVNWQTVFIVSGVFIFAVLFLPTYVDKDTEHPTIQERAARPTNATIRLEKSGSDEWMN
jgi:fatty acid desaturase